MSRWAGTVDLDQLRRVIAELEDRLRGLRATKASEAGSEIRRIRKVLEFARKRVSGADCELIDRRVFRTALEVFSSSQLRADLDSFASTSDQNYLIRANDKIEEALSILAQITPANGAVEVSESLRATEETFDAFTRDIHSEGEKIRAILNDELAKLREFSAQREEFSAALKSLRRQLEEKQLAWSSEHTENENQRKREFSQSEANRAKDFQQQLDSIREGGRVRIEEIVKELSETTQEASGQLTKDLAEVKADAEAKRANILELHGLVAVDSVSAGFLGDANKEGRTADNLRLASFSFIGLAAISLATWSYFSADDPFTGEGVFRLIRSASLTLILLVAAGYAARQSAMHRANERRNKRFALETRAFDPFVASLPEGQKNALKEKISERLFGEPSNSADNTPDDAMNSIHPKMFEQMVRIFKEIRK